MSLALDQARLVVGAQVQAPADHPCPRWARIIGLYRNAPVARILCACGWYDHVPLRRLVPEPVPSTEPVRAGRMDGPWWTEERIIAAMRAWAAEHGRAPTSDDWRRSGGEGHPGLRTVEKRFGSFTRAALAAGLAPVDRRRRAREGAT